MYMYMHVQMYVLICMHVRMYAQCVDPGLWTGSYSRPDVSDDTVRGDQVLPGTRGHRRNEVQGER